MRAAAAPPISPQPTGLPLLRARLDPGAHIETLAYGEQRRIGAVDVSLHPAGHVLGSAQIRIAHAGGVAVVSGDYKLAPDPTCAPFEPVPCDLFVTESTFGLPIYRWDDPRDTMRAILALVERQPRAGPRERALRLCARQGAAHPAAASPQPARPAARPDLHARRDRAHQRGVSRGAVSRCRRRARRGGAGRHALVRRADRRAAVGARQPLDAALRSAARPRSRPAGWRCAARAGARASTAASRCPTTPTGRRSTPRSRRRGAARVLVTHGYRDELTRWLRERGVDAEAVETRFEGETLECRPPRRAHRPTRPSRRRAPAQVHASGRPP